MTSRVSEQYDPCTEKHTKVYFNLPEVQKALHVPSGLAPSKWDTCRYNSPYDILELGFGGDETNKA